MQLHFIPDIAESLVKIRAAHFYLAIIKRCAGQASIEADAVMGSISHVDPGSILQFLVRKVFLFPFIVPDALQRGQPAIGQAKPVGGIPMEAGDKVKHTGGDQGQKR